MEDKNVAELCLQRCSNGEASSFVEVEVSTLNEDEGTIRALRCLTRSETNEKRKRNAKNSLKTIQRTAFTECITCNPVHNNHTWGGGGLPRTPKVPPPGLGTLLVRLTMSHILYLTVKVGFGKYADGGCELWGSWSRRTTNGVGHLRGIRRIRGVVSGRASCAGRRTRSCGVRGVRRLRLVRVRLR